MTAGRLEIALRGHYRIERELGRGGMATVYLATDLKHQREVALKVLHPELAAAIGPERFLREIQIAAQLSHPHIVPLHDSGDADGLLYYVMPYVRGESLRSSVVGGATEGGTRGPAHRDRSCASIPRGWRGAGARVSAEGNGGSAGSAAGSFEP